MRHVEPDRLLRVTLPGDRYGDYVIVDEREDGSLVLAPDTSMAAIRRRHCFAPATLAEFEANTARCSLQTEKVAPTSGLVSAGRRTPAISPTGKRGRCRSPSHEPGLQL